MACRFRIELDNAKFCDLENVDPSKTTVLKLKELIQDKEGIDPKSFGLIYGGVELTDGKLLSEYDVGGTRNAIMMSAIFRWKGGAKNDKLRDPDVTHPKLKLSDKADCLSLGAEDEPTVEITICGCVYAPSSLHSWADDQLRGKIEFKQLECPNCKAKKKSVILSFDLVACGCGWNEEEYNKYYQLFKRKQLNSKEYKNCPFCYAIVHRKPNDQDKGNRTHCGNPKCISSQDWCWKCCEPWKSGDMKVCGNLNCLKTIDDKNFNLKNCPTKKFGWGDNMETVVPIFRACINDKCNQVFQHSAACNHMTCPLCNTQWCFICLQKWPCPKMYTKHKEEEIAARQVLKQ